MEPQGDIFDLTLEGSDQNVPKPIPSIIRVNSTLECLERFDKVFHGSDQRQFIRDIIYQVMLPPVTTKRLKKMQSSREAATNNVAFTQGILDLFNRLREWEGNHFSLKLKVWSPSDDRALHDTIQINHGGPPIWEFRNDWKFLMIDETTLPLGVLDLSSTTPTGKWISTGDSSNPATDEDPEWYDSDASRASFNSDHSDHSDFMQHGDWLTADGELPATWFRDTPDPSTFNPLFLSLVHMVPKLPNLKKFVFYLGPLAAAMPRFSVTFSAPGVGGFNAIGPWDEKNLQRARWSVAEYGDIGEDWRMDDELIAALQGAHADGVEIFMSFPTQKFEIFGQSSKEGSAVLLGAVCQVWAKSSVGDRVLVVLEDASEKQLYSQFWQDLESRDFQLSFESPKSDQLSLFKHGELAYDHLILTPPKSKGYGPALTPKLLLDYTNAGGNVLLGLSSAASTPSAISSLLLELDIALPADRTSVVVDHFHYDTSSAPDRHDVLLLPRPPPLRPDVINFFGGDGVLALPNTVGQSLGNTSPLLAPIVRAPTTAYTYNPKDERDSVEVEDIFATGSQLSLISALQARNNARFVVLGSLEMLQDKWFEASVTAPGGKVTKTANREFAQQLTEWVFKEVGVLKVVGVQHQLVEETSRAQAGNTTELGFVNPQIYRIKSDVTFSIALSLYSHTHYVPFNPPTGDEIQLEFSMLSPFHRLPLVPSSSDLNSTTFTTTFTTPDQHGIFAFKVDYNRPFLTNVEEKRQVTVRHFAHDEWPRSFVITGAWPWVTGLWSVIGGFVVLIVVWLYCDPQPIDRRRAELAK
ncbi:hypothetical protein DV735_g1594, partial [Chaetothyriales sp. CBS 134920]